MFEKEYIDKIINDDNRELIELMRKCNIKDENILITLLGFGSHKSYYNVLKNRINNDIDNVDDNWIKREVIFLLKEIDRSEDM
ncbi:MAG: hypothetical protein ACI4WW_07605 [Candidatus Coprovivens sp.]